MNGSSGEHFPWSVHQGVHGVGWLHRPQAPRRRWDEDGLLGEDSSFLAVVLDDDTLIGFVSWRNVAGTVTRGAPARRSPLLRFEIGIALLPEYRGKGYGTEAESSSRGLPLRDNACAPNPRHDGVMRGVGYRAGKRVDVVVYSMAVRYAICLRHEADDNHAP